MLDFTSVLCYDWGMKRLKSHKLLVTLILLSLMVFAVVMMRLNDQNNGFIATQQIINSQIEMTRNITKYEIGPPDPQEMLELVNEERAKVGVAPLTVNENVQKSAQLKADDMARRGYYDHVDPEGKHGYELVFDTTGAYCYYVSENIAAGHFTSKGMIDGWVGSESHYRAMVDPKYTETGFGVVSDNTFGYKGVQHFCAVREKTTPLPQAPAASEQQLQPNYEQLSTASIGPIKSASDGMDWSSGSSQSFEYDPVVYDYTPPERKSSSPEPLKTRIIPKNSSDCTPYYYNGIGGCF